MKAQYLQEPELEFGVDKHIDIKFGLMNYGPLDFADPLAPKRIQLGIVGTAETIEGVAQWLEKCRGGIDAKPSKRPNLFPRFPGFGEGKRLCADIVLSGQLQRPISPNRFAELCQRPRTDQVLEEIAQLFLAEIEYLEQKTKADIFVCALPFDLVQFIDQEADEAVPDTPDEDAEKVEGARIIPSKMIFHDFLKARAMQFRRPTQIIRPHTYDERKRIKGSGPKADRRQLEDEATRAWNLYAALYYKAGGTPWRMMRDSSKLAACYIGVSFYEALDETKLLTSTAQVFNERGEGVIVRGGTAHMSKDDRQIHLSAEDAYELLKNALQSYWTEHKNYPARVVVHKSSIHNANEIEGFERALRSCSIDPDQADFVSITDSHTRLFRGNRYPPLRGTFLETGGELFVLYTRGSVDFFSTYPGLYVPHPLGFRPDQTASTPAFLAEEMLALTKMNWNNTQFGEGEPITLRASRQVGSILKYLGRDYEPYYRFYM